ncbi:MAG: hypothetical protein AAFZ18_32960 [Myxococcota bacterium]
MASPTGLGLPSSLRIERTPEQFSPHAELRHQLSSLVEDMVVARLPDGRRCTIGWHPERSPGGAFRVDVDHSESHWADSWSEVTAHLTRATQS